MTAVRSISSHCPSKRPNFWSIYGRSELRIPKSIHASTFVLFNQTWRCLHTKKNSFNVYSASARRRWRRFVAKRVISWALVVSAALCFKSCKICRPIFKDGCKRGPKSQPYFARKYGMGRTRRALSSKYFLAKFGRDLGPLLHQSLQIFCKFCQKFAGGPRIKIKIKIKPILI